MGHRTNHRELSPKRFASDLAAPVAFAGVAFVLLLATANNYGIFTDELYFVACAEHLGFGYVDQPPLIAWVTRFSMTFGSSLYVLRVFPALACVGTVVLVALVARGLGGSRFAAALASLSIFCGTVFWVMFGYVSMNAYDIFFITLASHLFILILQKETPRLWILLGIVVGLGLNTKLSMLVFAFGLVTGLILTSRRGLLSTRYPYIAAIIALGMFLPHLIWQAATGWPTLEFIKNVGEKNLNLPTLTLLKELAIAANPLLLPLWVTGLWGLFRRGSSVAFRPRAISVAVFFGIYLMNRSKFYYLLPPLPLLLAAGSVAFERWTESRRRWFRTAAVVPVVLVGLLTLPLSLPILPIGSFVSYARFLGIAKSIETERNDSRIIPGYFRQRIGWPEFVRTVAAVYHALPDSDRAQCGILGFHYGESAAVDYFGPALGLPKAIGRHNSYWLWGPGEYTGKIMIVIVSGEARVEQYFNNVELRATYIFPYIDGSFGTKRIYVCRDPVEPLPRLWPRLKVYD